MIVLFDGECILCNRTVHFILKRDPGGTFRFASLQSSMGKNILRVHNIFLKDNAVLDTAFLIDGSKYYTKSTAMLRIIKKLHGLWPLLYIAILIPAPLRDIFYTILGKYRYKWFGKTTTCPVLPPEFEKRFLQ